MGILRVGKRYKLWVADSRKYSTEGMLPVPLTKAIPTWALESAPLASSRTSLLQFSVLFPPPSPATVGCSGVEVVS